MTISFFDGLRVLLHGFVAIRHFCQRRRESEKIEKEREKKREGEGKKEVDVYNYTDFCLKKSVALCASTQIIIFTFCDH